MGHAHHFLTRLDRLADQSQLEVAKFLHGHGEVVGLILGNIDVPDGSSGVAIALSEAEDCPWVILSPSGAFVTCLSHGMRPSRDTVVVPYALLVAAFRVHIFNEKVAWLVRAGIEPHLARIRRVHDDGEIALVSVGSNGRSECRGISRTRAERCAENLARAFPDGERAARAWLRGRRPGRIFVIYDHDGYGGTYCLNLSKDGKVTHEPGTTDEEQGLANPAASATDIAAAYVREARKGRIS
jgi:hypothetical protein